MARSQQDYADLQAERDRIAATVRANEALKRSLNQLAGDRQLDALLGYVVREALQLLQGACAQVFLFDAVSNTMTSSIGVDREGNVLAAPGLTQGTPMEQPFPANITKAWERVINHRGSLYFDIEQENLAR
ncbi:GAF domain protein [Leptolyngbya sp. NIES-3755]|nr:GAF domain protein [Leptolyngbya sp. NIES-3755]